MDFRIADTFTDSLARLAGEEQKAVKTTAFDLQMDPTSPGMSFHKLEHGRDPRFWSVRVSSDIRLIVHRTDASLLLCYVDHHDKAYAWAERRKLSAPPMGVLLGVSAQTIYNWEAEKTRPRQEQLAAFAALRGMGKRQAAAKLQELAE